MKFIILAIGLLVITACSTLPTPKPITPAMQALWQTNQSQLQTIQQWQINGRIAITTPDENWIANVYWQQQGDFYRLQFHIPPGQSVMALNGNSSTVTLRTSDDQTFVAQDPDELIQKVLKLMIPVKGLRFWILGIPTPNSISTHYQLDDTAHLSFFQQDGWNIEYKRYQDVANTRLPDKITLQNDKFKVKIAISEWNLTQPSE